MTSNANETVNIYRGNVTSVYDADSITLELRLGFGIVLENFKLRLARIDAPEIRGSSRELGIISRDALRELILNKEVEILFIEKGKYGRHICEVMLENNNQFINISDWLLDNNFADEYTY